MNLFLKLYHLNKEQRPIVTQIPIHLQDSLKSIKLL